MKSCTPVHPHGVYCCERGMQECAELGWFLHVEGNVAAQGDCTYSVDVYSGRTALCLSPALYVPSFALSDSRSRAMLQ